MAYSTAASRATRGTQSNATSGSGAAGARLLQFFQHHERGALADGHAAPVAIERATGFGSEELQRVEAHEADARERVHAASDRGGDHAVGDEIGGERQRRGAGAAR